MAHKCSFKWGGGAINFGQYPFLNLQPTVGDLPASADNFKLRKDKFGHPLPTFLVRYLSRLDLIIIPFTKYIAIDRLL